MSHHPGVSGANSVAVECMPSLQDTLTSEGALLAFADDPSFSQLIVCPSNGMGREESVTTRVKSLLMHCFLDRARKMDDSAADRYEGPLFQPISSSRLCHQHVVVAASSLTG